MEKNIRYIKWMSATALIAVVSLIIFYFFNKDKVAYIDNNKLVEKYTAIIEIKKEIEKNNKGLQANLDTLAKEFQTSLKKYEKESAAMSVKERVAYEQLLTNKQQQFSQYKSATESKAQEESNKLTGKVLTQLNDYIKAYGKEHGYKIIFGANNSGNIVYANDAIDITEEIIEGANNAIKK